MTGRTPLLTSLRRETPTTGYSWKTVLLNSAPIGNVAIFYWKLRKGDSPYMFFDPKTKCLNILRRTPTGDELVISYPERDMETQNLYPLLLLASSEGLTDWKPSEPRRALENMTEHTLTEGIPQLAGSSRWRDRRKNRFGSCIGGALVGRGNMSSSPLYLGTGRWTGFK